MTRPLRPHGTWSRYRRHLRDGERACDVCQTFVREDVYRMKARREAGLSPRPRTPLPPPPHGTYAMALRHRKLGERPCDPCRLAQNAYRRAHYARTAKKPPRELLPHGTMAAYLRHYRRGERPCDACREANTAHGRAMRERKRKERVA